MYENNSTAVAPASPIEACLRNLEQAVMELEGQSMTVTERFRPVLYFPPTKDGIGGPQGAAQSDLALRIRSLESQILTIRQRLASVCDASEL